MILNLSGGAGAGLNFKVVGGITAPENPKENTIWVDTDVEITSWVFSVEQPANPIEGMVWIYIGTFSSVEFNALKKNGIQLCPIFARQYIDGVFVDKATKSYQDGEWVGWIRDIYLYNNGDVCTDITGDYAVYKGSTGSVTWNDGDVRLTYYGTTYRSASICTTKLIDFTNATELHCVLSNLSIDGGDNSFVAFGLCKTPDEAIDGNKYYNNLIAGKKITISNADETTYSLDISSVIGSYYFTIYAGIASVTMRQAYYKGTR